MEFELRQPSRPVSPDIYHNDISATDTYPDYLEEVALYFSSRVSSTPSVTGLDGPRTTRVFDVFQDEYTRQSGEHSHRKLPETRRKRGIEYPLISSPSQYRCPSLTTINAPKSRGRRVKRCEANKLAFYGQEVYKDNNITGLMNAIRYLKRF